MTSAAVTKATTTRASFNTLPSKGDDVDVELRRQSASVEAALNELSRVTLNWQPPVAVATVERIVNAELAHCRQLADTVAGLRGDVHRVRAASLANRGAIEEARSLMSGGNEAYAALLRQRRLDPATAETRARLLPLVASTATNVKRLEQVAVVSCQMSL